MALNFRIGELNRRLEIQAPTKAPDGMGAFTTTWKTLDTVWAELKPLRGNELLEAMQVNANVSGKIIIRYRQNMRMSWRGKIGNRIFNFKGMVNPEDDKKTLEIMVTEQVL
jgi:SPP1 family predicted phage head-tail adaptor